MRFSDIFKVVPISTHARNSRPIESDGCEKNRAYFFVNRTVVRGHMCSSRLTVEDVMVKLEQDRVIQGV